MQKIIFDLNPIVYSIAITLLVVRFVARFIPGGCFDCEPSSIMIAVEVWGLRIGTALFLWAIGVSVVKKLHKK